MSAKVKPGYKQTEVGVIPEEWDCCMLRDGIVLLSGHHILAHYCNMSGCGVPYLTGPADFRNGAIANTKFTNKPATLCSDGDILVTVKGSGSGTIVVADKMYCISRQLMAIRPLEWNSIFLYYSLLQNALHFKAASAGLIPGLSRSDILEQLVPLPPLPAQNTIADALSDVDVLLGALDRLIAKKRDLKQAAMQQLLTGETRLPGFHGEWAVKRLGDLGTFLKGNGIRKDEAMSGALPCVRYGEIYTHHNNYVKSFNSWISPEVAVSATRLKKGDLLFAGSGETKEEIGKCVACIDDCDAYAGGDIVILRLAAAHPLFMGYYCNIATVNAQKASRAQGDAVVHIGAVALSSVLVSVPSVSEQVAIAEVLFDMDAELAGLEQRRDKTRSLKQSIMQELLTGKTRLI
uniref:Restriction modification system DNA specificity domain protein n=1 Tax=Geobacter sp. (strain M21) TaxID=443144 RepID=C6DZ08_GEOSM